MSIFIYFLELAVLDVPYGLTDAAWDKRAWDKDDFHRVLTQISSCTNNQRMSVCIFISVEQYAPLITALSESGWNFPQFIVWHKTTRQSKGGIRFANTCEYMVWAWKTSPVKGIFRYPKGSPLKKDMWMYPHIQNDAFICTDDGKPVNICQKPKALLKHIIKHHSNPGSTVLDLCAGSHSLLFTCVEMGRHCISVERDERQHQSALQHWYTMLNDLKKDKAKAEKKEKAAAVKEKRARKKRKAETPQVAEEIGGDDDQTLPMEAGQQGVFAEGTKGL